MKANLIIEITNCYLKVVAYRDILKSQKIIKVFVEPISPKASLEDKAKILKDLLRRLNLKSQNIGFCISRKQVMVRNFSLPAGDIKDVSKNLSLQIEKEVPYRKEETISGYQILNKEKDGYTEIISAIIHRDAIKELFNISEKSNIYPEKIELSSCGALKWFLKELPNEANMTEFYLLLDIDRDFSDFIIFQRDKFLFTRSISQKAEALLQEKGQKELADKIKQSLIIFQTKEPQKKPVKIFLSGAKLISHKLTNFLEREFNLPVETASFPSAVRGLLADIPQEVSVSAVCGLAISGKNNISFVLPEIETRRSLKIKMKEFTLLGSFLLYFLVVVSGIFATKVYKKEIYLKELGKRYQQIAPEIKKITEMQNEIKIVKERLDMRQSALNCLSEIHRIIPTKITLKNIDFCKNERIILRGYGKVMSDIFNFVNILEESFYFKNVEAKYTSKKKLKDEEVSEFEIVCPIGKSEVRRQKTEDRRQ